tara:strand:+ start:3709 stop:4161 length:453 start_codon:yes stop_codon:yes gene_type:complete
MYDVAKTLREHLQNTNSGHSFISQDPAGKKEMVDLNVEMGFASRRLANILEHVRLEVFEFSLPYVLSLDKSQQKVYDEIYKHYDNMGFSQTSKNTTDYVQGIIYTDYKWQKGLNKLGVNVTFYEQNCKIDVLDLSLGEQLKRSKADRVNN